MTSDITEVRNQVFQRIGRNIVLFQELERILKFLASVQHPSTPLSKAKAAREKRVNRVRVKSLGQLAGQVVHEVFTRSTGEPTERTNIAEPWLGFSFQFEGDAAELEENRKKLEALIDERNQLVHHLLSRWNSNDLENCNALAVELDEQQSRTLAEIERYGAYAVTVQQALRELRSFLDSDEAKRQLGAMFRQDSLLAKLLTQIAATYARADGWTLFSTAGHQLELLIPEEYSRLKRERGSLRKLIEAIDLFDVQSEELSDGKTRFIYRTRLDGATNQPSHQKP